MANFVAANPIVLKISGLPGTLDAATVVALDAKVTAAQTAQTGAETAQTGAETAASEANETAADIRTDPGVSTTYIRLARNTGRTVGDAAGNYTDGTDGVTGLPLASAVLGVSNTVDLGAVSGSSFRLARNLGRTAGDAAGNYVSSIDPTTGAVTQAGGGGSSGSNDGAVYGPYDVTTVSSLSQIRLYSGSGSVVISDGTANDTLPQISGAALTFLSDRDSTGGAATRPFRMNPLGATDPKGATIVGTRGGAKKIYLLIGYGQSLSFGTTNDTPAAYSTAAYQGSALMFNAGIRIIPGQVITTSSVVDPANIERLIPLASSVYSSTEKYGQTHIESLIYRSLASNSINALGFCSGVGGQAWTALAPGTIPWSNTLAAVQAAVDILTPLGYEVEAHMAWVHGEAEASDTLATYTAVLNSLYAACQSDIASITGQSAPVHLFLSQSPSLNASWVPVAGLRAAQANAYIHCIGPAYDLPETNSTQHLASVGYFYLGEIFWRAFKAAILDSGTWTPLSLGTPSISGAVITVPILGATGALQIDATGVSAATNYGIEYTDNASPPAISSVAISGSNLVVTLAAAPTATAGNRILRAAWTRPGSGGGPTQGARTNICDSDPMTSTYDGKALPKRLCCDSITF